MRKLLILLLLVTVCYGRLSAQSCTTLGQTPATAFPVCGTSTFSQSTVPTCLNNTIPTGCSDGALYSDKNPYWYKFTCFASGTLGFEITPNTTSDDYDWQIFDVTGHDPSEVYSNTALFVSGNWSSNSDSTGASPNSGGDGSLNCAGPTFPNQNTMPTLIKGHNYLLLVSHFTNSQSGYSLAFGGGTASITDTTQPRLTAAQPSCDGTKVNILLNKNMQCSSLAADGSDFSISPSTISITKAFSAGCSNGFDMDTVTLVLSGTLTPGDYTITAQNGSDDNTLLDNCGTQVQVGAAVTFNKPVAPQPTPLDSISPVGCSPSTLKLVFSKRIQCSSILSNGSNFSITGPVPVTITGAQGNCDADNESSVITLRLAAPIQTGGAYTITLVQSIIDECGVKTPIGSAHSFIASDTVNAAFSDQVLLGCKTDSIEYFYQPENGVNQWQWIFDGTDTVNMNPDPMRVYSVYGNKTARLSVTNGVCSDTSAVAISLNNAIFAKFEAPNMMCPKDQATFANNSTGSTIISWNWNFGDGTGSSDSVPPPHSYPITGVAEKYAVMLIVSNGQCSDSAVQYVDVLRSCYIAVPSAFTPNGDGINDYLYPLNAFKADNLQFRVYNRFGQLVFQTNDWQKKWDGKIDGHPEPAGTFVWTLSYTDRDTGKKFVQKGTTILIR